MLNTAPEVSVACAVIWRNGQVLLAKRHANAHQGGLWEFPGGKLEPGEPADVCLARELSEELGIVPETVSPICQIPWTYADKTVRLWVFEVTQFAGEAVGREGQPVRWVSPNQLELLEFPAANRAIVRAVGLPRQMRVFDAQVHQDAVGWVLASPFESILYFRGMPPSRGLRDAITTARDIGHAVVLTLDQLACFQPGCGVHLRKSDHIEHACQMLEQLDRPWPLTAGIRSDDDWQRQRGWPADAWLVSPVQPTPSHPDVKTLGWQGFAELIRDLGAPAFALGGMSAADLPKVQAAFGYGVAGIRGL